MALGIKCRSRIRIDRSTFESSRDDGDRGLEIGQELHTEDTEITEEGKSRQEGRLASKKLSIELRGHRLALGFLNLYSAPVLSVSSVCNSSRL